MGGADGVPKQADSTVQPFVSIRKPNLQPQGLGTKEEPKLPK